MGVVGQGGVVDDEIANAAAGYLFRRAEVELPQLLLQPCMVGRVLRRVGPAGVNSLVGILRHPLQGPRRSPHVRIDPVGMVAAVPAGMRTRALDPYDAAAQVHDLRAVFDFVQQSRLELEKTHVENELGLVQSDELSGCRFERFGARSGRDEHFDPEIFAHDLLDETAYRQNRHVQRLFLRCRLRRTGAQESCDK